MNATRRRAIGTLTLCSVVLVACGSGGGSSPPPPPPPPAAPVVAYAQANHTFTTEVAISTLSPTVTGGTPTQWTVSPALPAGLALNTANGQVTGSPTQSSAAATYAVTASNAGGSSTFNLNISVNSGTLLELGHANNIVAIRYDGSRILSRDGRGIWALWNAGTGEQLASGSATCPIDCDRSVALAGSTAVIASDTGLLVRNADDGAVLWDVTLAAGSWWALASDGTYLATGDTTALTVRSRMGAQLFQIMGNFAGARPFATPTELRVALSPAGSSVIQRIAVPAGTSTNSTAFQGEFHSWFTDGARFFTDLNSSVWVYSADGTLQGAGNLATKNGLAGTGERFWIRNSSDLVFHSFGPAFSEIATIALPALSANVLPSGNTLGVLIGSATSIGIVDLAPITPTFAIVATPISHLSAYAATSAADPVFGNQDGVLLRDVAGGTPPQTYTRGRVRSIAGSATRFAISFSSGEVHYYDASSRAVQGVIEIPPPRGAGFFRTPMSRLQLSGDGSLLGVGTISDDGLETKVTLYSLPAETLLHEFVFSAPEELTNFSMSGSGEVFSFLSTSQPGGGISTAQLTEADGTVLYADTAHGGSAPVLSDSGASGAFSILPLTATSVSRVIQGGVLTGTLNGAVVNWLDEQRLIVNRFRLDSFGFLVFDGAQIVDTQGQLIATPALPHIDAFTVVAADRIYAPQLNAVLDATNGNTLWTSTSTDPSAGARQGAVAGNNVVFATGTRVRIEPYP
jgi:hypothetical protein